MDLTLPNILGLALADAVNPCALAVISFILIAILTKNPNNRKKVLFAGLAFTLAVFILYFLYGVIIIQFFRAVFDISGLRLFIYKIFGVFAVLLGLLNVKDFIKYKPGGIATEMPVSWRPKVKKIIENATSTKGAFVIGIFVTLFLLPCTIGPYLIAGGVLSTIELIQTMPWLLLYNIIFVFPMLLITVIIYIGLTTVENVSGWKERNIRYLHLITGLVMLVIGSYLFFL